MRTVWDKLEDIPRGILYGLIIMIIFLSTLFGLTEIMPTIIIILIIAFIIIGNIGCIGNKLSRKEKFGKK